MVLLIFWVIGGICSSYVSYLYILGPHPPKEFKSIKFLVNEHNTGLDKKEVLYFLDIFIICIITSFFSGPIGLLVLISMSIFSNDKDLFISIRYVFKKIHLKLCSRKKLPLYINVEWETQELETIYKKRLYGKAPNLKE